MNLPPMARAAVAQRAAAVDPLPELELLPRVGAVALVQQERRAAEVGRGAGDVAGV
jgi:hypothetical protein